MVSKSKLYSKLDDLERELKERLAPHLESAAAGNNDYVFCVNGYHSFNHLRSHTDKFTTELVKLAAEVLALKIKLNESSKGSIAERICWYCREWGNTSNNHRVAAQGLAKQFLNEISKA